MAFRRMAMLWALVAVGFLSCRYMSDFPAANRDFQREEFSYSIIRYQRFLEKHRRPRSWRETALIRLAQSYEGMRASRDAENTFLQYEKEFPEGRYIETARESLDRIRQVPADREQRRTDEIAAARQEILRIQKELEAKPKDTDSMMALGHAYWKTGQYQSAGEMYLKAIELKPELRESPILTERLFFDLKGGLVLLHPRERVALESEQEPLAVEGLSERRARGISDFFTPRRAYYVVSGTVRNRSTRPVMGVQVQVTLYDSLEQILEVRTVPIGTLYPQQARPFAIESGLDAEAMGNIARYRAQPTFQ